jgi:phosphoserine aminotransferase
MLQKGIDAIRRETDYKAAVLYQALAKSSVALPFVADVNARSKTVIVANTGDHTTKISEALNRKGMLAGSGYGELKASQLRFANFPTHSKEQYEMLADTIEALT